MVDDVWVEAQGTRRLPLPRSSLFRTSKDRRCESDVGDASQTQACRPTKTALRLARQAALLAPLAPILGPLPSSADRAPQNPGKARRATRHKMLAIRLQPQRRFEPSDNQSYVRNTYQTRKVYLLNCTGAPLQQLVRHTTPPLDVPAHDRTHHTSHRTLTIYPFRPSLEPSM